MKEPSNGIPRRNATVTALCAVMWLLAVALAAYGLWLIGQPGRPLIAVAILMVALLAFLSGLGLYQMRRWGVALFAGLTLVGSVNHIVNAINRFSVQHTADPAAAMASILGVLVAFLVPFIFIYLILMFWRQAR